MTQQQPLHTPSTIEALPPNWYWSRLDDACEGVFDCPHSTPTLTKDGPLVVRSQDIRSGVLRTEEAGRVSEETYRERIAKAEPKHGDLLYSREGTYFGIAAELPRGVRACLGQRMVLIRPKPALLNFRFLRYWLNSPALALHVHGHRDGTVAERLNLPTIRGLPIAIAPLRHQELIADSLGSLDDKIELNGRTNETLEVMAQTLFRLWFVGFDPVRAKAEGTEPQGIDREASGLFPDAFEMSRLGPIPKGWRVGTVGETFSLTMGQSPPGDTYNATGEGVPLFQGRAEFGFRFPTVRLSCTAPTRFAELGDTLVSVRAPVGDVNMADRRCCIGRGLAAVRHGTGSRSFTYYSMRELDTDFARFEAEGTVFGSINKAEFAKLLVVVPPNELVQQFERQVYPLDQLIEANSQQMENLAALRDTLLPKLLSGEIRVLEANRLLEAAR